MNPQSKNVKWLRSRAIDHRPARALPRFTYRSSSPHGLTISKAIALERHERALRLRMSNGAC